MAKKVTICVTNDLCTDQRIQKVSTSLHQHGYEVLLVGRRLKNSLPFTAPYTSKRFRLLFTKGFMFYAMYNVRLFLFLVFSKSDIILANDTDTLPACYLAAKMRNKKLVFDAHELFPEVPEVTDRHRVKKVWTKIEDYILPKVKYSYTVSQAIANYYQQKYGIKMQVIRNVPYYKNTDEISKNNEFAGRKILIYQGAVNIGRGLEWVIDCLPLLNDECLLLIIGDGDITRELKERIKKLGQEKKVHFTGKKRPDELISYTLNADIGLCLLKQNGLSYYYSLPNRIFDFIQAGVPVLATNFPEIAGIVREYKTGVLINHYEPEYLSKVINQMLKDGKTPYAERLKMLSKEFCWENEENKLLAIYNNIQDSKRVNK